MNLTELRATLKQLREENNSENNELIHFYEEKEVEMLAGFLEELEKELGITRRTFRHEQVRPDGTFANRAGAVEVKGGTAMSAPNGGCGVKGCNCSPGYWVSVVKPRSDEGVVEGYVLNFPNKEVWKAYLKAMEIA